MSGVLRFSLCHQGRKENGMENTTIAAISTPLAVGAIGIVRLSGPRAKEIVEAVFTPVGKRTPRNVPGFSAIYGRVHDQSGQDLDEAVVFIYTAPKSYTGEDVAEISCHGGIFAVQQVLRVVLQAGAVPAQPGEFTKRAFLNGKMNLTQAEGVMDLISARGAAASRAALAARDGALSRKIETIAKTLTDTAAHLAAWVDYPEEDVEAVEPASLLASLGGAARQLDALLAGYDTGRMIREGIATAIVGRPNVGKSTLMNLLAGAQRSIVTDIPGTTRDVVEDVVRLGPDIVLNLADTAGIRQTDDPIETVGVQLARQRLETSALVLAVFDASTPLSEEDLALLDRLEGRPVVAVLNKTDLPSQADRERIQQKIPHLVALSAKTGEGTEGLAQAIRQVLHLGQLDASQPILANERQRSCVLASREALEQAIQALEQGMTLDAVTVCVEDALEGLLELDGKRVSDTVVEQVFEQFCVGK